MASILSSMAFESWGQMFNARQNLALGDLCPDNQEGASRDAWR